MANINVGEFFINLFNWIGKLGNLLYGLVYYYIPALNCRVIDLIFIVGIPLLILILILKFIF